jgi:hypothetical protein
MVCAVGKHVFHHDFGFTMILAVPGQHQCRFEKQANSSYSRWWCQELAGIAQAIEFL